MEAIKSMEKAEGLSEDEVRAGQKEVQDATDEINEMIDDFVEAKQEEIMEV